MEEAKPYGVTMLVTPPSIPASLAELTVFHHTSLSGDTSRQQRYYKAEEVEQLLAGFNTPVADAELAELVQAQAGFPRVFVAEGLEIGTVAGWRIAEMNGNKSDDLFAKAIAQVWNALPGLLARHRTSQEIIGYHTREIAALRGYIDGQLTELLAHPELPESIHKVLYAHRQILIVAKEQADD